MYGFMNQALQRMITQKFGEDLWDKIKNQSDARVASPFHARIMYDDKITCNIVETAADILGFKPEVIWQLFGETFFEFCEESGYDKILNVLGGTLRDFLENLDALHDHLSSIYPAMRPPSFRCWTCEHDEGGLVVQYHSERDGLEDLVVGLLKALAERLQNKKVSVALITPKGDGQHEHARFLVTDAPGLSHKGDSLDSEDSEGIESDVLSDIPRISPATFSKVLPFHIMFNRSFHIAQVGDAIVNILPELEDPRITFPDVFEIIRPHVSMVFDNIVAQSNSVFVIRVLDHIRATKRISDSLGCCPNSAALKMRLSVPSLEHDSDLLQKRRMCLKGQMLYVEESDKILFICSPHVGTLDELTERGLYLSDLPLHDSTRDLLLLSEQLRAEYELTRKLEEATDTCQRTYHELQVEKQLADKLLYSILPPSVADQLRLGKPVPPVKYQSVTILFSGICDFNKICNTCSPIGVVNLLNELYLKFDALAEPRIYNVYKVETVGDKYMLASGLPERTELHARNMALVALDMMDVARDTSIDGLDVKIRMGMHSGEVVSGVVGQRLPHYAVFGSTVCVASRMESCGLPDHINVSQATHDLLVQSSEQDSQFILSERGSVQPKGMKSPMRCFLLLRNTHRRRRSRVQAWLESGGLELPPSPDPGGRDSSLSPVHLPSSISPKETKNANLLSPEAAKTPPRVVPICFVTDDNDSETQILFKNNADGHRMDDSSKPSNPFGLDALRNSLVETFHDNKT